MMNNIDITSFPCPHCNHNRLETDKSQLTIINTTHVVYHYCCKLCDTKISIRITKPNKH